MAEVNVKALEVITPDAGIFVKKVKPNFKALGPKVGRHMKAVKTYFQAMDSAAVDGFENRGFVEFEDQGQTVRVDLIDAEVVTEDIPGMLVATSDGLTVALDATLTDALRNEGLAREMVNRLQNLRKSSGLDVVDRIDVQIAGSDSLELGITPFMAYIKDEVLADAITFGNNAGETVEIEGEKINISIFKK